MAYRALIITVLVLSCSGVRSQEDDQDLPGYKEYLEKCKLSFPNLENIMVYGYEDSYCQYYCYGQDNETIVEESFLKENGVKCTPDEEDGGETYVCMKGECYLPADIEQCKAKHDCIGETTSIEVNECNVTCIGHGQAEVVRTAGYSCKLQKYWGLPAKCDENGVCQSHRTFVSNETGDTTVSEDAAKAICEKRQPGFDVYVYMMGVRNVECDFNCNYESPDDDDKKKPSPKSEYLTFENGYTCGEDKACVNGKCVSETVLKQCKEALGGDLKELIQTECSVTCVNGEQRKQINLPLNSTCLQSEDYYWLPEGRCDENGKCIAEESNKEYE